MPLPNFMVCTSTAVFSFRWKEVEIVLSGVLDNMPARELRENGFFFAQMQSCLISQSIFRILSKTGSFSLLSIMSHVVYILMNMSLFSDRCS